MDGNERRMCNERMGSTGRHVHRDTRAVDSSGVSMSVIVMGMEMPTSCMDCPFKGFDRAGGRGNICTINESITLHAVLDGLDVKFVRMGDCPLIELPAHGRLIDADAFSAKILEIVERQKYDDFYAKSFSVGAILRTVVDELMGVGLNEFSNAPTIIPADKDGAE